MKKRHVVVSAEALADLDAIFKFLSEDSPAVALRIVGKLEEAAADLQTTALHYPIVAQRSDVPVHRRVVGSYNILFWVSEDTVGVLRFLHGKRRIFTDSEAN
jgi:plasmid stabilization system protein ParE